MRVYMTDNAENEKYKACSKNNKCAPKCGLSECMSLKKRANHVYKFTNKFTI